MLPISFSIPSIRITPAPPVKVHPEPYSPFPSGKSGIEDDGYRARWLSLPPSVNPSRRSLRLPPANCSLHKGLSQDQFDSLLKASREQWTSGIQRKPDLHKESALQTQKLKQYERRARFLSKVMETPCAVVSSVSEVPLPTIPRYSMSARRIKSGLSPLEVTAEDVIIVDSSTWPEKDEQLGHGLLIVRQPLASSEFSRAVQKKWGRTAPSLAEITAHLQPVHLSSTNDLFRSRRPNSPKALGLSSGPASDRIETVPVRSLALNDEKFDTTFVQPIFRSQPPDPCASELGLGRAVIPHTVDVVAGSTLHISRAETARDMIATLRRRSPPRSVLGRQERIGTLPS